MASHHQQPASPAGMHLHHGPPGHPQVNGVMPMQAHHKITPAHLASLNEAVWLSIGAFVPHVPAWKDTRLTYARKRV